MQTGGPLLIFVAGPYNADSPEGRSRNVSMVHEIIEKLIKLGHYVLECHSLEHALLGRDGLYHQDFVRQTLHWLTRCDALYLVKPSPGANIELSKARELGLLVFLSMDEVPPVPDAGRSEELSAIVRVINVEKRRLANTEEADPEQDFRSA